LENNKPSKKRASTSYNQNKIQINNTNETLETFSSEKENLLPKSSSSIDSQIPGKII